MLRESIRLARREQGALRIEGGTLVRTDPGKATSVTPSPKTAHLKLVPAASAVRRALRQRCREVTAHLDKTRALAKDEIEAAARGILRELNHPEGFVGWTMVALSTEFWRDQVSAIPPQRRLFLLPANLDHDSQCGSGRPSDEDAVECVACAVVQVRSAAERSGYLVHIAQGAPDVLRIIVGGQVDAIVGVAHLNDLEKALDPILLAGIPCMAVPLLSNDGEPAVIDDEAVRDLIDLPFHEHRPLTRSFVHLLRGASQLFEPDQLERLAPRTRGEIRLEEWNGAGLDRVDPIAGTEAIAYDFLSRGGKYLRPFITLAVYDALRGSLATGEGGSRVIREWPDSIKRAAMSIETFHKASLVHDDIEDEDLFRYGRPSLHRTFGVPTAINVGDYLIGLGYRLVSREKHTLGGECVADILDVLADSHQRLSEGQGAELFWREAKNKHISLVDALRIYALKTAPAFEASFLTGIRLASPLDGFVEPIKALSRELGIAFQILNDLADWHGDQNNKMARALDLISGRPTVLWALAMQDLNESGRKELERLVAENGSSNGSRLDRAARLYDEAGVGESAIRLIDKYQSRAKETAAQPQLKPLHDVLVYLIDLVLEPRHGGRDVLQSEPPKPLGTERRVTSP